MPPWAARFAVQAGATIGPRVEFGVSTADGAGATATVTSTTLPSGR